MAAKSEGWNPLGIFRRRNGSDVEAVADRFQVRSGTKEATVVGHQAEATALSNEYYNLVTDFYEYGWGQSFHFAPRYSGESFREGIARHEYFLALHGGFTKDMKVLDIGCGVGGPARNIARFSGCNVMGVNNNAYQITRGRNHDSRFGLNRAVDYTETDFCNMPFADASYDGAFAIEATCHAADKVQCYSEIFRCLKPGARFVSYEWVVTDNYDDSNELHRKIRRSIEIGNALPALDTGKVVVAALEKSGFVVEESYHVCERFESGSAKSIPWYNPLEASYTTLNGLKSSPIGRTCTTAMCFSLELVGLAPKGTRKTAEFLEDAAVNLVLGGRLGIFTPSYFVKALKPLTKE